jgi:hypothetical protein
MYCTVKQPIAADSRQQLSKRFQLQTAAELKKHLKHHTHILKVDIYIYIYKLYAFEGGENDDKR